MSTNKIDDMTETEAKNLLNDIANNIGICGKERSREVILLNIKYALHSSSFLPKSKHENRGK